MSEKTKSPPNNINYLKNSNIGIPENFKETSPKETVSNFENIPKSNRTEDNVIHCLNALIGSLNIDPSTSESILVMKNSIKSPSIIYETKENAYIARSNAYKDDPLSFPPSVLENFWDSNDFIKPKSYTSNSYYMNGIYFTKSTIRDKNSFDQNLEIPKKTQC